MPLLLACALFLLARPPSIAAETIFCRISAGPEASNLIPVEQAQAGIAALFASRFARLAELSFETPAQRSGSGNEEAQRPMAAITIGAIGSSAIIDTEVTRGSARRSLRSSVPRGAIGSAISSMAGDLAFLWFSFKGFSELPLSRAPPLAAALDVDTLSALTGWEPRELEPLDITGSGDEVTICFPHRYLTLGPLFRIDAGTVRDIEAQSTGREPLQLSGIVGGRGDKFFLLSESSSKIARADLRLGSRELATAPRLTGRGVAFPNEDSIAVPEGAAGSSLLHITVFAQGKQARSRTVKFACSFASAAATDGEGNLWVWDAEERRIRILIADGTEVFAIKPLFPASIMPLPQQIAVFPDGSFLLGGSGELWKFENSGVPVWKLTRAPGRTGERLPGMFSVAVAGPRGGFTLLDAQSRRVLQFSEDPSSAGELGALLSRIDRRKTDELQKAALLAREKGLDLMALQFADQFERRGGSGEFRATAELALLREKTRLMSELADSLLRDLLYDRAERAYLRASDSARELAAREPDDPENARLLESLVARRREVRESLSRKPEVRVVSAEARVITEASEETESLFPPCGESLRVSLEIGNTNVQPISLARVHIGLPGISATPVLVEVEKIPAGGSCAVETVLALSEPARWLAAEIRTVEATLLVAWEQDGVVRNVPLRFSMPIAGPAPRRAAAALAGSLLCAANPRDALVARLVETARDGGDPFAAAAGALDFLGRLRRSSAGFKATTEDVQPLPAAPLALRSALRSLSSAELDWISPAISIASALGVPVGVLAWKDKALLLLDTGIPLSEALSSMPGLEGHISVLRKVAKDDLLCLPFSARLWPSDSSDDASTPSFSRSIADALAAWEESEPSDSTVVWVDPAALVLKARPAFPVPFPIPFGPIPPAPTRDTLRGEIIRYLERQP